MRNKGVTGFVIGRYSSLVITHDARFTLWSSHYAINSLI